MAQLIQRELVEKTQARGEREKALKILAKSVYRELKASGYVRGGTICSRHGVPWSALTIPAIRSG